MKMRRVCTDLLQWADNWLHSRNALRNDTTESGSKHPNKTQKTTYDRKAGELQFQSHEKGVELEFTDVYGIKLGFQIYIPLLLLVFPGLFLIQSEAT